MFEHLASSDTPTKVLTARAWTLDIFNHTDMVQVVSAQHVASTMYKTLGKYDLFGLWCIDKHLQHCRAKSASII